MLSFTNSLYVDTDDIYLLTFCSIGGIRVLTSGRELKLVDPVRLFSVEKLFCITAMSQVTFRVPAEPRIRRAISVYLFIFPFWSRSPTHFMFPIFVCFMFPVPDPDPNPRSPFRSTLHHILLVLFLFPLLFPTLCLFPMTLICSLQYCYAPSHLLSSGPASDPARSLLWSSGPARLNPLPPRFIISAYSFISLFLILLPHAFHVSDVRFVSCPLSQTPFRTLNPEPCSVLLRITSPCSLFVPMLFCPNPCLFPSTLLCSFRYLYIDSFLYVPQSEINIDCPLWTSVRLIRTFRIHWNLHLSKLRTRERQEAKHQSLSRVLIEPYCRPSSLVVPESFGLPCIVLVRLRLVSVFNRYLYAQNFMYVSSVWNWHRLSLLNSPLSHPNLLNLPNLHLSKLRTRERQVAKHQSLSPILMEPCRQPSLSAAPEGLGLPCSVSVHLRLFRFLKITALPMAITLKSQPICASDLLVLSG